MPRLGACCCCCLAAAALAGAEQSLDAVVLLAPKPLTPRPGMRLTDVALHFQFSNCTADDPAVGYGHGCFTYDVQMSRSAGFEDRQPDGDLLLLPTLGYCCDGGGQQCPEARYLRRCSHDCDPSSQQGRCDSDTTSHALWHARPGIQSFYPTLYANVSGLWPGQQAAGAMPTPGEWFWRVRGYRNASSTPATGWSQPSSFILNNNHEPTAPIRPITPASPLLHLEGWIVEPAHFAAFAAAIPPSLRNYSALCFDDRIGTEAANTWSWSHGNFEWGGTASYQLLGDYFDTEAVAAAGVDLLIAAESGPHWVVDWQSLAEIEWLFQQSPRFIGVRDGERFWNWDWYQPAVQAQKQAYARALMILCAK